MKLPWRRKTGPGANGKIFVKNGESLKPLNIKIGGRKRKNRHHPDMGRGSGKLPLRVPTLRGQKGRETWTVLD